MNDKLMGTECEENGYCVECITGTRGEERAVIYGRLWRNVLSVAEPERFGWTKRDAQFAGAMDLRFTGVRTYGTCSTRLLSSTCGIPVALECPLFSATNLLKGCVDITNFTAGVQPLKVRNGRISERSMAGIKVN